MSEINTVEQFKAHVAAIQASEWYRKPEAFGLFATQRDLRGEVIAGHFLTVNLEANFGTAAVLQSALKVVEGGESFHGVSEFVAELSEEVVTDALEQFNPFWGDAVGDKHLNVQALNAVDLVSDEMTDPLFKVVFIFDQRERVESLEAAYLKLACMDPDVSAAHVHTVVTDGMKEVLPKLYWKGNEAITAKDLMVKLAYGPLPEIRASRSRIPPYMRYVRQNQLMMNHFSADD